MFNFGRGTKCNLECAEGGIDPDRRREFVGPVRIIFVAPAPLDYQYKVWTSAILLLAYIFVLMTAIPVLLCTFTFALPFEKNLHIAVFTLGFHLLIPTGILMLRPLFSAALHMDSKSRRYQHAFLQLFAGVCVFAEVFHLFAEGRLALSIHGLVGYVASSSLGATMVFGFLTCPLKQAGKSETWMKARHRFLSMLTMVSSVICLGTGILKPSIHNWFTEFHLSGLPYAIIVMSVIYTLLVFWAVNYGGYV